MRYASLVVSSQSHRLAWERTAALLLQRQHELDTLRVSGISVALQTIKLHYYSPKTLSREYSPIQPTSHYRDTRLSPQTGLWNCAHRGKKIYYGMGGQIQVDRKL